MRRDGDSLDDDIVDGPISNVVVVAVVVVVKPKKLVGR